MTIINLTTSKQKYMITKEQIADYENSCEFIMKGCLSGANQPETLAKVQRIMSYADSLQDEVRRLQIPPVSSIEGKSMEEFLEAAWRKKFFNSTDYENSIFVENCLEFVLSAMSEWASIQSAEKHLIIAGLEQGSEAWKAEYGNCRKILTNVIENMGSTEGRNAAIELAKQFLQKYQHQ